MLFRLASLVLLASLAQDATAPEPPPPEPGLEGLWLTQDEDGKVRIERCGERFCGRLVWMAEPLDADGEPRTDAKNPDPALRDRPLQGLKILDLGAAADRKGVHHDCRIYDAARGDRYRCKIRVEGDRLRMRGYLGISLFGRTVYWTRVE
jgi:uncharacterized protein (DUF2147 family)